MRNLIYSLWMILFFAIPAVAIFVAGKSFGKFETVKLIGRLLASVFFYLISTVITLFILAELSTRADARAIRSMNTTEQFIGLLSVYVYFFTGYLICSYISGEFFKPWKIPFNSKENQSVFNLK